jgi:hypothetical protein
VLVTLSEFKNLGKVRVALKVWSSHSYKYGDMNVITRRVFIKNLNYSVIIVDLASIFRLYLHVFKGNIKFSE